MTTITVVRRVPAPIVGVCGIVPDRAFEAFEQTLDWDDDVVVSAGARPTRSGLARLVGRSRLRVGLAAAVWRPDSEQRGD